MADALRNERDLLFPSQARQHCKAYWDWIPHEYAFAERLH
jgi:hypothetical protein